MCIRKYTWNVVHKEMDDYKVMNGFGKKRYLILHRETVDSTNDWAKEEARLGALEGTVLTANMQTVGKGRRGRSWESPAGTSIYMSLILRPQIAPEKASMLTLVAGLSVVQTIREQLGLEAMIKWPNDAVIFGKKICGILTEMNVGASGIEYVVVGIGINVNTGAFPEELADKATSLWLEYGKQIDRQALLEAVLDSFFKNYELFLEKQDLSLLLEAYNSVLVNRQKSIRVLEPEHEYDGISGGINEKGELLVTREDGTEVAVYAGEVSVRGIYGYV